jgi:hypothetical protein
MKFHNQGNWLPTDRRYLEADSTTISNKQIQMVSSAVQRMKASLLTDRKLRKRVEDMYSMITNSQE